MTLTTILLFGLAAMGVILLIVLSSNKTLLINKSVETETTEADTDKDKNDVQSTEQEEQTSTEDSALQTETAFVVFKSDERQRILDEYHHSSIHNERFELILEKPDGNTFQLCCSKTAHSKMPYRKTGTVTFKDDKFIKFQSEEQTVSDEYTLT